MGISQDGRWIAGSDAAEHGTEAFLYDTRLGTIVGLGDLPGDTFRSNATAISADGGTVVGYSDAAPGWEAFVWRAETGMRSLGDFDGGTHLSQAYATNADGTVTVGFGSGDNGREAFRHDADGLHALGDLPEGDFESRALGVSGDGRVIVGYGTGALTREAVVWIDGTGPQRVRDVLTDAGADLTGWELDDAAAISMDGLSITGFGLNPAGDREAWIATLPSCPTDLDGDGTTGVGDLLQVLGAWGESGHPADVDGDGIVGVGDLLALFAAWGVC
jgi:uncharacterized membrane protein